MSKTWSRFPFYMKIKMNWVEETEKTMSTCACVCICTGWPWYLLFAYKKCLLNAQLALVIPVRIKKEKVFFLADVLKVTTHWAASCGSRDEKNDLILYSTCHRDADYNANHFCWYNKTYMWRMDKTNYCCLNLSGRTCQQRFFFSCLTEM